MPVFLSKSDRNGKKWKAQFENGTTVHFGASGYQDYTMHKDSERKERYIQRHMKHEDWKNVYSAGFWSRWLLWNKPTLNASISDIEKRFNLKIKKLK